MEASDSVNTPRVLLDRARLCDALIDVFTTEQRVASKAVDTATNALNAFGVRRTVRGAHKFVLSVHIHCREKSFAFQEPVSSDDGTAAGLVTDRASRFVKHHLTETLVVLQQHFTVLGLEHVQALTLGVLTVRRAADVTAHLVHAPLAHAGTHVVRLTFVDIYASGVRISDETLHALAGLIEADGVQSTSTGAEGSLIFDAALVVVAVAADIAALDVHAAVSGLVHTGILHGGTLVHVVAGDSVADVARLTEAELQRFDTEGMPVADVLLLTAVGDRVAVESVSGQARIAFALESSRGVGTLCSAVAGAVQTALVDVHAFSVQEFVARRTPIDAVEATDRILAHLARTAVVKIQLAFVDVGAFF